MKCHTPASDVATARCCFSSSTWRCSAGMTLVAIDCFTRSTSLSSVSPASPIFFSKRRDDRRLVRLLGRAAADDPDRLVEREVGRDHADAAIVLQPLGLAIDVARIGIDPVGKGESVLVRWRWCAGFRGSRACRRKLLPSWFTT